MRFTKTLVWALLLCPPVASGDTITGRVTDPHGRGLPSVSVITNVSSVGTMTDEGGLFTLDAGPAPGHGEITRVTFSSVGYHSRQFSISSVPDTVVLQERFYRGTDILVRGERAEKGLTPIAFEDFSADDIKRDYTVGEFPLLLEATPNFFSYTDGGAPLGYSYTSIRGFDDKRITTYINGVPLNDPEDQATYFVDLPDFASNIDDIQVQRGVGNSLYGDASFGGTINVAYNSLSRERYSRLTFGYGEFTHLGKSIGDTYKQSVEYSSGLIDGRWHFTGRYSKQKTDGYRRNSWYEGWAYAFSLARLDANMTTELYLYGGPMKMHLAYYGATRRDITADRRSNVLTYSNETDNFNQPHYHLHNTWQIDDHTTLANTLYYIRGKGYYEQYKGSRWFPEYNIDPPLIDIDPGTGEPFTEGDLVRQQWVYKNQWGWNPTLTLERGRHTYTFGGSLYYFESDHWGQVVWAQHIAGLLPPQHQYYHYYGKKWAGSFYAQAHSQLTERLSSQITAQLRYQRYQFDQVPMALFLGHDYDLDWLFFSPRVGANYKANDHIDLFANFAVSSRMPTDASIYDASDPYALPSLVVDSVNADSTYFLFGNAIMKNERVYDFELGAKYSSEKLALETNLFWMDFSNEIIQDGGYNENNGLPFTTNAPRSVHAGFEFSLSAKPSSNLTLGGNLAYNHNLVKEYVDTIEVYDENWTVVGQWIENYADKKLPEFPGVLGGLVADWQHQGWRVTPRLRWLGKRYVDLANKEENALDPCVVASLSVQYAFANLANLGRLTLMVRVDNLGDKKYESTGYGWVEAEDRSDEALKVNYKSEYFVGPERSFWFQMQLEMF